MLLKLRYAGPVVKFGFSFNLRRYTLGNSLSRTSAMINKVRRRRSTLSKPVSKALLVSVLEAYDMMNNFQTLLFNSTCAATTSTTPGAWCPPR
jgi:hypothetical protein